MQHLAWSINATFFAFLMDNAIQFLFSIKIQWKVCSKDHIKNTHMLFYDAIKSQMTSFFTLESASLIAFIKFCPSSSSTLIAEFYIALKVSLITIVQQWAIITRGIPSYQSTNFKLLVSKKQTKKPNHHTKQDLRLLWWVFI